MGRKLTPKELEILKLLADGLIAKEIALKLGNSPKTIDVIRTNMLNKTGAKNTTNLVYIATKKGWI